MPCQHKHGDTVSTYWLCGQCYAKLADRPVKYVMESAHFDSAFAGDDHTNKGGSLRQMPIYAPVLKAASGLTLSQFITAIARRLVAKTGGSMTMTDATDYAVDLLEMVSDEFGASDFDWSTEGAWELVSEDMQNWDGDAPEGN